MSSASVTVATEVEVARIRELSKAGRHSEALAAAEELARAVPGNRDVLYLAAANQRCLNRIPEALASLQRLEQEHPRFSLLYQERGHCYVTLRDAARAMDAFRRAVELNPALAASWSMLERLYRMAGDVSNAAAAAEQAAMLKRLPTEVVRSGSLFSDGDLTAAEDILRMYLREAGEHPEAMRLLARIEQKRGVLVEAERLLQAALSLVPDYRAARLDYVRVLVERQNYARAYEELEGLLKVERGDRAFLAPYAAACAGLGKHDAAIRGVQGVAGRGAGVRGDGTIARSLAAGGRAAAGGDRGVPGGGGGQAGVR